MNVGARIKAARQAAGLTQGELAERLEVEQSTISRWENEADITVQWVAKIAHATGQPFPWFFGEEKVTA